MPKIKGKCETPSCERHAACAGLCAPCYAGVHYWKRKGVKQLMVRKHQLRVLDERLEHISPANVVPLRRRA